MLLTLVSVLGIASVEHQAAENRKFLAEIQQSRLDVCRETNERHDATIRQLDLLLGRQLEDASAARKVRIRASRDTTIALIDALAPKRDCHHVVEPPRVDG